MAKAVKKETPKFVVDSRVKEFNQENGLRTSGDFTEALNAKIASDLEAAQKRCTDNGRSTLRPSDL